MSKDRFSTGTLEVIAVTDGGLVFEEAVFPTVDPAAQTQRLSAAGLTQIQTEFTCYLLRHRDGTLDLIDAGCGVYFGENGGALPARLAELGVSLGDIRRVYLTHMHRDHFGGLVDAAGQKTCPGAEVWIGRAEHASVIGSGTAGEEMIKAYAGQIYLFDDGQALGDGLTAWHLPGHTGGHMGFVLDGHLALVGDILHSFALQLPDLAAYTIYDDDAAQGQATRIAALKRIADEGLVMASSHALPGQKFVRLVPSAEGYRAEPA
jgi:glyoxylase-like metal-dependent hydrolase (beta-lactamase superfamily II)